MSRRRRHHKKHLKTKIIKKITVPRGGRTM